MKNSKRPLVGLINTLKSSGDNVHDDTTSRQWSVVVDNTADPLSPVIGPFQYGKTKKVEVFASEAEVRQIVAIDCKSTSETIVADTRYTVMINNPGRKYESDIKGPIKHSYTSPSTLSGNAATDRKNVYEKLRDKINSYAGNDVSASLAHSFDFTLGGAADSKEIVVGDELTQETSGETAIVTRISLSSGAWGDGDAEGTIWVHSLSSEDDTLETAQDWTATSNSETITQTNATLVLGTGLVITDDAGYFLSSIDRQGYNAVMLTQGFSTATAEVTRSPVYAKGIGSVMVQKVPQYDKSKQDVIWGDLMFEIYNPLDIDATKDYSLYAITVEGNWEDTISLGEKNVEHVYYLFVDENDGTDLSDFDSALDTAAAK